MTTLFGQAPIGYTVDGVVLDPSGAVIRDASLTLAGPRKVSDRSGTTGLDGRFLFSDVPQGHYTLRVETENFRVKEVTINVPRSDSDPLTIVLSIADLHEGLTIYDTDDGLNATIPSNSGLIALDEEMLNSIPSLSQNIVGTLSQMIGAISGEGVTVVVDGLPDSGSHLSPAEIKEVRVHNDTYSAEYSTPGSGRIEIKTKDGSKDFHGSVSVSLRDHHFDGRNAFSIVRPKERRRVLSANLSGPLQKSGNTSFVTTFERDEDRQQAVINALTPVGPIRENAPKAIESTYVSGKVQHVLNDAHSFALQYRHLDWRDEGELVGGLNLPQVGADYLSRTHDARFGHKGVLSPSLLSEFSLAVVTSDSAAQSRNPGVRQIVVLDAFTGGGAQLASKRSRNYFQMAQVLSWSKGRHLIKAGLQVPTWSHHSLNDRSNFDGTYYFSTLEDFNLGRPFAFVQNAGESHLSYPYREIGWFLQDNVRIRPNLSLGLGLRQEWQRPVANQNNLAPRLSMTYAPGKDRRTVMRAGAGIFYERSGHGPVSDVLRFDGQRLKRVDLVNPGYPEPFVEGTFPQEFPASKAVFDSAFRAPYSVHYTGTVERQLSKSTVLTASYVGVRGVNLFRSRDTNAPFTPLFTLRPDPAFGVVRQIESSGNSMSHRLKLGLQGRLAPFFDGGAYYTLGRVRSDTEGIDSFPADSYDLSGEWGLADNDTRHRVYVYGTVEFGKLFQLGIMASGYSSRPYTITTGFDRNADSRGSDRPVGVGRNTAAGPAYFSLDLRWSKSFTLPANNNNGSTSSFFINVDAFNVLNSVNKHPFVGNLSSPFFGQAVSAEPSRRLQLSGGLRF